MVEWYDVAGIIEALINDAFTFFRGLVTAIRRNTANMLTELTDYITELFTVVIQRVKSIFNDITNDLSEIFSDVARYFQAIYDDISTDIAALTNGILDKVTGFVNDATTYISDLITQSIDFISNIVSDASDLLYDTYNDVSSSISILFADVSDNLYDLLATIKHGINSLIDSATIFLTNLFDTVAAGVNNIINSANEIVVSIASGIDDFIRSVVDVVGNSLQSLLETIADLPGEIQDLAQTIIDSAKENIADPIINFPINLIDEMMKRIGGQPLAEADKMNLDMLNIVFGESPVNRSPEIMRSKIAQFMPEHPLLKALITSVVAPIMLVQVMGGIASANSQILLQEHALVNPYRLFEPGDVIRARHFDLISEQDTVAELRKTGYTESTAQTLMKIGKVLPPAGEMVSWMLRGLISDTEFDTGMTRAGWTPEDIATIKQAAFFIPPVNDLITMAVREVFTPDIAEQFGQFEDFPPQFVEQAAKQGVNEEWAKRYWGAHWSLPSVQMGFEMLHRRVITQDDLTLLLRASDIMPFWRDKLIEISFSPLTRVDVRRMHKVGVLSEEEVNRAYHDIGYNDENAARLTEFTIALNSELPIENELELSSITRSNIIGFFTDGIISETEAIEFMVNAEIDQASAELFVSAAALDIERRERKDSITIVINQAKSGQISFDQAQDELNKLGLEETEKIKALTELDKLEASRNKLPSKGDLDKMLTNQIIDDNEYLATMSLIGYNSLWSNRYLQLIGGGENGA